MTQFDLAALEQLVAQAANADADVYAVVDDATWREACSPAVVTALCRVVRAAIDLQFGLAHDLERQKIRAASDALDAALAPFRGEQP